MAHPHPHPPADTSAATDERATAADARLTELEVKVSYADDLLDTLNTIVAQQQQQIDRLVREVQQLRQQSAESPATPRNLRDELPPHY